MDFTTFVLRIRLLFHSRLTVCDHDVGVHKVAPCNFLLCAVASGSCALQGSPEKGQA